MVLTPPTPFPEHPFPKRANIETTNACNLKCPMCARTTTMTRDVGDMSAELFRKIADELGQHDIDHVWLHLYGEPLMHPNMFEFIDYIKQYPSIKEVGLSTNVTVLDEAKAEALVRSKIDHVILALDAATAGAYAATRGANFDHVMRNVTRFLELRTRFQGTLGVQIQLIPMTLNVADIDAFREQWAPHVGDGVEIVFKAFTDFAGQVEDFGVKDPDPSVVPVQFVTRGDRTPQVACAYPWEEVSIHAHGGVVACCFDVDGQLHLGDVTAQTIEEIWRGPLLARLRDAHARLDFAAYPLCAGCSMTCGAEVSGPKAELPELTIGPPPPAPSLPAVDQRFARRLVARYRRSFPARGSGSPASRA